MADHDTTGKLQKAEVGWAVPIGQQATIGPYAIKCACMQEITMEHLRLRYHPPCMRNITIVLEETL